MTGFELASALRKLPSDVLRQTVIFELGKDSSGDDAESVIVTDIIPFSAASDMDGNFIKLS